MRPNFTARKSMWAAVTWKRVLFFWLIVPLILMIAHMIRLKYTRFEFYDDKVVKHWGVFNKHEKIALFAGVLSVHVYRPLLGRIFKYGHFDVDVQGKWDFDLNYIKKPGHLKKYLDQCRVSPNNMSFIASS